MMFTPTEKGQGLVEYALILVLVAMFVLAALTALGPLISDVFDNISNTI
ncbi:MAG: Flp family type IVb pilin [Chloroflexi bacterium]|nr:Flp family type IVb pilin [Chloroflexota bacterium]